MRSTILIQSTAGGALLGLLAGVLLVAVVILVREVAPDGMVRLIERVRTVAIVVGLVILPAIGGWLGYLEGRLKLE